MAFLRQLKLLLWKNGLGVLRQPLWSLTLIIWPLIIFIIVAVTRHRFPPIVTDTCYVAPRNLPSAGFFPFLQTLMCNTDSNCHNTSRLLDTSATKSRNSRSSRSLKDSPLFNLVQNEGLLNMSYSSEAKHDTEELVRILENLIGPPTQGEPRSVSSISTGNFTALLDHEALNNLVETVNLLKKAICTVALPLVNTTSPSTLTDIVATFCRTNNTVFEASLYTLNQILTDLMQTEPDKVLTVAGAAVMLFSRMQNETVLWENLLAIPELFSGSGELGLSSTYVLLTHIQSTLDFIENNFPETSAPLSVVQHLLAGVIDVVRYAQHWRGRNVYITLGDVVILNNNSINYMVKQILQNIQIPLDKAVALTLNKDAVRYHLCENSSNPIWLTAACSTGTVDLVLHLVSSYKVGKQALLAWSKHVALEDMSFAKELIHRLMEGLSTGGPGGSNSSRTRRSMNTQPQSIEEDLFLSVGQVLLDLAKLVPEVDMILQRTLNTGFQTMRSVRFGINTVEEIMNKALDDVDAFRMNVDEWLSNRTDSSDWINRVMDSVTEAVMEITTMNCVRCEEVLGPFEWLLPTEAVRIEVWRAMICFNSSKLDQLLQMDWRELAEQALTWYNTIAREADFNATLPMILYEWHNLSNSSLQFEMLVGRLAAVLDQTYWMNWMPENNNDDATGMLLQSIFQILVHFGERIEKSNLWPGAKNYFHMVYWILNYKPSNTTASPNCTTTNMDIHCDTGLNWPGFAQAVSQILMSPHPDVVVNLLKGTVNLLEYVYGDILTQMAASYFKQELKDNDALSDYLINLMDKLNVFVHKFSTLSDQNINNPDILSPLIQDLLECTGLAPLVPVIFGKGPFNASMVFDVAYRVAMLSGHMPPNATDMVAQLFSLDGNLTIALSHIMGHSLLTYSGRFIVDNFTCINEAINSPNFDTSTCAFAEALVPMEILKRITSPDADPESIILQYIQGIQNFLISLFRMHTITQETQPNGQLTKPQVADLSRFLMDFLSLFTPEGFQKLILIGPDAAQSLIVEKVLNILPPEVLKDAASFFKDFKNLQDQLAKCTEGNNCREEISEIFTFVDQILDMMLSANGNASIRIVDLLQKMQKYDYREIINSVLSLVLPTNDAASVESVKQILHFINLTIYTPNITVSSLQDALRQSNLTIQDLEDFASLAGAANIHDLLINLLGIVKVQPCFDPQNDSMETVKCVTGLVNNISGFLTQVPALHNNTAILSLLPWIVNTTISDILQVNFSSSPNKVLAHTLSSILENIKTVLQHNQLTSPEIMNEIKVVQGLIKLIASIEPDHYMFNSTLMNDPMYAQSVYLQLVGWYLEKLENITSTSSASELLQPFFQLIHMQLTVQLSQLNVSMFISHKIETLMKTLQYPLDGVGVKMIGLATVEILQQVLDSIKTNLENQNTFPGYEFFNQTTQYIAMDQAQLYLTLIKTWMEQPSVPSIFTNMLQWGNTTLPGSSRLTDILQLLQTLPGFLKDEQLAHLAIIKNISQSLNKALMVAETGSIQSEAFTAAIVEIVSTVMQVMASFTGPMSESAQHKILEIVQDSLSLMVHPNMSFAASRNISLHILKRAEYIIMEIIPDVAAEHLVSVVKVITTYFETISVGGGQDKWNELILNELLTVQSLLPPNSTAHYYISALINTTSAILHSSSGNVSLWGGFEKPSVENLPATIGQLVGSALMVAGEAGNPQSEDFSAATVGLAGAAVQLVTSFTGPMSESAQHKILEIVQDSLNLIVHPNMSFAASRNISLHILKRAEYIIMEIIPDAAAEHLVSVVKVITTYFETISEGGGQDNWNELILNEMKLVQNLLPPNSTAHYYISALVNATYYILQSDQGNKSPSTSFQNATVENLPAILGQVVSKALMMASDTGGPQSEAFTAAIVEIVSTVMQVMASFAGPLSESAQHKILEIVQDSLSLMVHPNMSFAASRNISLHILKRAEYIIMEIIPDAAAEHLVSVVKVITTYFETISEGGGQDNWNELILNEMKLVQNLLPPNSTAHYYISALVNATYYILQSDQGNKSPSTSFQNATVENLPAILGQVVSKALMMASDTGGPQSEAFTAAIVEIVSNVMQVMASFTGPLSESAQHKILEIVQDSLNLIVHPNMSFAASRNISLHILKRAEYIIMEIIPDAAAEHLVSVVKVITTYFETISEGGGQDKWNELILNEMKLVQNLLPPNSTAHYYISALVNATYYILQSDQGNKSPSTSFQNATVENLPAILGQVVSKALMMASDTGGPQSEAFTAAIVEIVSTVMQVMTSFAGPLSESAQHKILEIVQDSLSLIVHPNMSFAASRNISLHILKRAEYIIMEIIPDAAAEHLVSVVKVITTYFETISEGGGQDNWNELILNEMKLVQNLLPPNSTAHYYISALVNATYYILQSDQGNKSPSTSFQNATVENLPAILGQVVSKALMMASDTGGPQSEAFTAAIVEIVSTVMQVMASFAGPLSESAQHKILEIVQDSLSLIVHPNMSFAASRNISLHILKRAEYIIMEIIPDAAAEHLVSVVKVITTYFETISEGGGQDNWNELILNEMKLVQNLLPPNSTAHYYISALVNATYYILQSDQGNKSPSTSFQNATVENLPAILGQVVSKALMMASDTGGPQSEAFTAAIVEIVSTVMQVMASFTGPLSESAQHKILEIVQDSLSLIVHPNMSFAASRNISLHILKRAEYIIMEIIPCAAAEHLVSVVKVITTYFETISEGGGQDNWNELILNEMETVESLLPPNSTAQYVVSALINVTNFILESGQGNMSFWASFENPTDENVHKILNQIVKYVSMFLHIVTGGSGPQSLCQEAYDHLSQVLEQMIFEEADHVTWNKTEQILKCLLGTFQQTDFWDSFTSVVPMMERIIKSQVKSTEAENALIQSLQWPVMTLIPHITGYLNSTDADLSAVLAGMQSAIEYTVKAAQQANGTLTCSEVLTAWEPVGEALGYSASNVAAWCEENLQPVFDSHAAEQSVYSNLNMSHTDEGPTGVSATAERIVTMLQRFYQVNANGTLVMDQLLMTLYHRILPLASQSLSPEAQQHLYSQIQHIQMQNSLSLISKLFEELNTQAPFLRPYMDCLVAALSHILNSDLSSENFPELFQDVALGFLSCTNITSLDMASMMLGNFSGLSGASLVEAIRKVAQLAIDLGIFKDAPEVHHALQQLLASSDANSIMEQVAEMAIWLANMEEYEPNVLHLVLPKIVHILRSVTSALTDLTMPVHGTLIEDLVGNTIAMLGQLLSTGGFLPPLHQPVFGSGAGVHHTTGGRKRRDTSMMMTMGREPVNDFIDLFYIDYPSMFKAISVAPTPAEMLDTAHVFFANPDLSVVVNGVINDMQGGWNDSQAATVDATLGVLSYLTLPHIFDMSSLHVLANAVNMFPDSFPFSSVIKNIINTLAMESQENLELMQQTFETMARLFQISPSDPLFKQLFDQLTNQVCTLESTETVRLLLRSLSIQPGQLCNTALPTLQELLENLLMNTTTLPDVLFQAFIGDPQSYKVQANWTSVFSQSLGFDTRSMRSLRTDLPPPGSVTVGEMMKDQQAFVQDVEQYTDFDRKVLSLLMNTDLPNNNLEILSWLASLHHCSATASVKMTSPDDIIMMTFCSMSTVDMYRLAMLVARHVKLEKLIYRTVLSEEVQSLVAVMLKMAEFIIESMDRILPAIGQVQSYVRSMDSLNLVADNEWPNQMRRSMSSRATFVSLSRALCSHGILALFGISQLPPTSESNPSTTNNPKREEMIERFKIPRDASPFCMDMYLDMVNTTGGAIAWAFLKPMLMGHILYTPDTPTTRAIMEKANATLQEFADLRKHSREWLDSSTYIKKSAEILSNTLPMLENSLGNSFVKNFIKMQTDIDVDRMKETLSTFSNMTELLEKNKGVLNQINALSTLMMNISSCIKFDRYRGFQSADLLDTEAQTLAKNRDLYASVIFKLPKEEGSSLPPKVSYTIRMHMDNVMRTDRIRGPYFVKMSHISAKDTMRYNRAFIYLQENIDRAIIETQAGQKVTEPAVQLQPFSYPCYLRDEYLEAISFVFPLMLMIAWVLFVADFVKKLVHERELRLHEYMKMMGVNPLSHFFAWFLECTAYLLLTIVLLTLLLKYGKILPNSDGFLIFLYLSTYGLSVIAFSYLVSSFFDKTYIAGLSGSLFYILCFFPFIIVMTAETRLTFTQKSLLSLFSPTCFSYASQYISRYESQAQGIHWANSYISPIAGDESSFGWLCWLMLIDSLIYFIIGAYIRMVFPGKYGIPAPWYFPFKLSFWKDLCCSSQSETGTVKGLLFANIMQKNQPVFSDDKGKGQSCLSSQAGEDFSDLPVGVALHGLTKMYGNQGAIENLNVSFYEGHVTSLLGHNGAGKTTTMSLLTGLFAPTSGSIEVYGRDMQANIDKIRQQLGVCMQYDVLFDHMTAKEHLLLYGQIKAPHWTRGELHEQVRTILEETGMHAHRHKRVGTLSGGMKRKLSISIAFIGGSRLVVLDEPTTGVDPCSRRSIWDIIIQQKKHRTIIMSTHHLDEAEVLSDRIALLERGGLKSCGSPFYLKDKLGQGYKLTLTKKGSESQRVDSAELKAFIQAHVPEARLKDAHGGDLVYSLPPFTSSNASSYRSLLTALDSNLEGLQLGGYGISDTTLEEVFLQMTRSTDSQEALLSVSESVSDSASIDSFPSDLSDSIPNFGDKIKLTSSSTVQGLALAWQQMSAILIKRFHHSRRDWKGLISQILLPLVFVVCAMGLGSIKSDLQHYPDLELSPGLYNIGPSYSFFSKQNTSSNHLVDTMMSFPGIDNACLDDSSNAACTRSSNHWNTGGNRSKAFSVCKCTPQEQICEEDNFQPPHTEIPSSQILYNLSGIDTEKYLVATANDFIRNRYGGFAFGLPLPPDLQMDVKVVPKNRTLSKVWFNPEGHHTMPAYLNSLNNIILRSNIPAEKDPRKYAISVSSHPYFGRADDEDMLVQGLLQILVASCVLTGYSIMTASFAIYEVSEHHSGSKRLQHIAGISEPFYWAVNFLYDMTMYMIPVTLTVAVIAAYQIPAFTYRQNLGAIALLLVLFGFATFPWMYLLAGVLKDAETAFITLVCINLFLSTNTIISTSILYFISQISRTNPEAAHAIFEKMCNVFLIFPQFNFGHGFMQLARSNVEVQILSGYGIDAYKNPFSTEALGWLFISSFVQGVVFFTLRLLINKSLIRKVRHLICGRKTVPRVAPEDEDKDVLTEHLRVSSGAANSDVLQVNQLSKIYDNFKKKVQAVKNVSVGIPAGECFGLLGVNGAGKTTTFKMLTGDISPTDGTAQIRDYDGQLVDIMECRNKGINIGYCPQVDALDDLLTGEEHLYFYARIRGISKKQMAGVVNYLLRRLELNYHRNVITDGYSCGTRRKLSTALALVGHPQILLLDEPSSGMDPRTKRHLWKIISDEVKGKCAVVLTSHSMEECEALCTRLAIMVKGQFRCLGSLQHIKNRFGSGFTVRMYLAEASCDAEAITGFMQRSFPSTYLKDQHSAMVEYHIPFAPGGVADIFNQLESNKNALRIKHFSVSQTTLDEVFINFAMENNEMKSVSFDSDDEHDEENNMKAVQT